MILKEILKMLPDKGIKNLVKLLISFLFTTLFCSQAIASSITVSPEDIISEKQQAQYFEKYLGAIEVGTTTKKQLELYIGQGYSVKLPTGERTYYIDPKNKKSLIIDSNKKDVIEVADYRSYLVLPPNIKDINQIKVSSRLNIKNLMTSMGSRMGYNYSRIVSSYGKPSVEINDKDTRDLKYIKLGSFSSDINFVYLEYSFRLKNNKVVEIRIENGK
jgi:hypothetical protein